MPAEKPRSRRSLTIGLATGIRALAFGWLGHPTLALVRTLFSVPFLAGWVHDSSVWRSRVGAPPGRLSRPELIRSSLANEDFEPAAKGR